MNNTNSKSKEEGANIYVDEDGILRVAIGASLNEEDVEKLINNTFDFSQKNPGQTKVLVSFVAAPHIPSFIFRKKVVGSIRKALKEIKNYKIAVYGGGTIQKTVASFVANASGLENIRFLNNEEEAIKWLKEEKI